MNRSELIVVGGGASGMMAALTAAERGVKVLLIEGDERLGRKIKQSGNGRCNFTNLSLTLERYHGSEPDFASYALNDFNNRDTIDFFRKLGVLTRTEEDRVYPLS
ncbi:MAG: FAD-binding protein, partial [Clostridiales bacterium]|nr:FAD-binding protein [Clostridiales bacterium]